MSRITRSKTFNSRLYEESKFIATIFWFPKLPKQRINGYFVNVHKLDLYSQELTINTNLKKIIEPYNFFSIFEKVVIPTLMKIGGYIFCPYNVKNNTIKTIIIGKVRNNEKYSDATIRTTKKYINNDFNINLRPVSSIKINKFKKFYISFNIVR